MEALVDCELAYSGPFRLIRAYSGPSENAAYRVGQVLTRVIGIETGEFQETIQTLVRVPV